MTIHVAVFHGDPLKSGMTRDYHDFDRKPATITLRVTGTIAGVRLDINTSQRVIMSSPPIQVTEGAAYTETGDAKQTLALLVDAIVRLTDGALRPRLRPTVESAYGSSAVRATHGIQDVGGGEFEVVMEAAQAGSWGHQITVEKIASANSGNLVVNGDTADQVYNPGGGAGDSFEAKFAAFLNGLQGSPPLADIKIKPLFTQSSSFLVVWETA
jgi:hypothetical protein